jgi:transposase
MITVPPGVRVLLATKPVDFRKGGHALAALAAEMLGEDPFSGVVLVFRAKRGDRVKIVHWDTTGLVLVWKQLEGGSFRWPAITEGAVRLSAVQFAALFAGLDFSRLGQARRIPTPSAAA